LSVRHRDASCNHFAILGGDLPIPARAVIGQNAVLKYSHVVLLTRFDISGCRTVSPLKEVSLYKIAHRPDHLVAEQFVSAAPHNVG
jgi:hypothetical protein